MRARILISLPLLLLPLNLGCGGDDSPTAPTDDTPVVAFDPATLTPELVAVGEAIMSIAGNDSGAAWALGSNGLVLRWNGATWEPVVMPMGAPPLPRYRAVWVDGDGAAYFLGDRSFAIHDGKTWTFQEFPSINRPVAMWGRAGDDIYAVENSRIFHYDGKSWEAETLPDGGVQMTGLAGFGDIVVAVGSDGRVLQKTVGERWVSLDIDTTIDLVAIHKPDRASNYVIGKDGYFARFSSLGSPDPKTLPGPNDAAPLRITGSDPKRMYVVGDFVNRFNGDDFRQVGTDTNPLGVKAIWESPDGALYIGSVPNWGLMEFDGVDWQADPRSLPGQVKGMWSDGEGGVFATAGTSIVHFLDGELVQRADLGVTLQSVWGSSPTSVWASSNTGELFHYDGQQWTEIARPGSGVIGSIWGRSATEIYAVGHAEATLRFDGAAWSPMARPTDDFFSSIAGREDLVIAWGRDSILRLVDGEWATEPPPGGLLLGLLQMGDEVVAYSPLQFFIAGPAGWEALPVPGVLFNRSFFSYVGNALDDMFATGFGGTEYFDGTSARPLPMLSVREMTARIVTGEHGVWLGGRNIVRYVEP